MQSLVGVERFEEHSRHPDESILQSCCNIRAIVETKTRLANIGCELASLDKRFQVLLSQKGLGITYLPSSQGVLIGEVIAGTAARRADIRPGDVIVSYNGTALSDGPSLSRLVDSGRLGDHVHLEMVRGGVTIKKDLALGFMHRGNVPFQRKSIAGTSPSQGRSAVGMASEDAKDRSQSNGIPP